MVDVDSGGFVVDANRFLFWDSHASDESTSSLIMADYDRYEGIIDELCLPRLDFDNEPAFKETDMITLYPYGEVDEADMMAVIKQ